MKKVILISLLTLFFISCNGSGSNSSNGFTSDRPKTAEELKQELKLQEQNNPSQYLTVNATMHDSMIKTREASFFHHSEYGKDGSAIKGIIKNSATVAKFKDVVLTVTFYSQTQTAIEEKDYVLYEFYNPNSETPFLLHVKEPEATKHFGISIKNAIPVE